VDSDSSDEREIRAARNQALFRAVNEKLTELNEAFVSATDTFVIACECADTTCVQTVDIAPDAYAQVRAHPRRFVVLRGHVLVDVENVVAEADKYVIVEKIAAAGRVAEELT
jgi:5-bromo-4-chloroindolyl phosphate hydrolysis protein